MRGRIFTLLDVTWAMMQRVSLVLGGPLVDRVSIRVVYWAGGGLLVGVGVLGLILLGGRRQVVPDTAI